MPVTFENDNDIIVYALECVIAHARRTQQIFVAQCVWWIASVIGLEQELVFHIDRLQERQSAEPREQLHREVSATPKDLGEDQRIDQVLDDTKQYLKKSERLRKKVAAGQTTTGRINPSRVSKERSRKSISTLGKLSKTEGINASEVARRKAAGECLRCAWPSDKKGSHQVKDCRRGIKLDIGTASFPKDRKIQTARPLDQQLISEEVDTEESSSEESSDDSL